MIELADHPIANIFPLLGDGELRDLADDIKANGLKNSICIFEEKILDGRNRYRACRMAGVSPHFDQYEGKEPLKLVVSLNLKRRHLGESQRGMIAAKLATLPAHRPNDKCLNSGTSVLSQPEAAALLNVGRALVQDAKRIILESPELAADVENGKTTIHSAKKEIGRQARSEARKKSVESVKVASGVIVGDFRRMADKIPDSSVDLIFTDPPYDRASVGLYADLAAFAKSKLREGGSCLAYGGQYLAPEILNGMLSSLRLWWIAACVHSGPLAQMREYGIKVRWKPIFWFVKGTRGDKERWLEDCIIGGGKEKAAHDWQQAESEASYFIERLCPADGMVCDPFLGGGTTAIAARNLARKWIGFEIDPISAKSASKRLAE